MVLTDIGHTTPGGRPAAGKLSRVERGFALGDSCWCGDGDAGGDVCGFDGAGWCGCAGDDCSSRWADDGKVSAGLELLGADEPNYVYAENGKKLLR